MLRVVQGYRPSRPSEASVNELSDDVWDLVESCWHEQPSQRPNASRVVENLQSMGEKCFGCREKHRWDADFIRNMRLAPLCSPFDALQPS